ncbi:hypothetical protein A1UU_02974 [Escherichia coli KTE79]|nr:hypothetical protein A171_00619 [Escherichia coli KTE213]ELG27874.1 hypothetical protein A1US_01488 [Escherichia coli KTE78]ELG31326.1 hypothetical protein A1UU_02974 [Escherichia coli KTE79]ELG74834.1 hypothetical protein A1YQ_01676 [Escherichia coli KTE140]ELJ85985.1 hypothetical protein WGY_02144 [Escherichia coli KTE95]GCT82408.1 hypothetical protein HmCms174_04398 [Escherichia coli]
MAIHDAGMFNVKEINRLKSFRMSSIAICVLAKLRRCSAVHHVIAADC